MKKVSNPRVSNVSLCVVTNCWLVTLLLLLMHPVYSATINVTSTADILANDGVCTLREAVIAANENIASDVQVGECPAGSLGLDIIVLTAPGTYAFSLIGTGEDAARTGDLDITEDVEIEGGDAATFIISASYLDRVFHIVGGDTKAVIRKLTVARGQRPDRAGGGIYNAGSLVVEDAIITNNQVGGYYGDGGGIYNAGDSLTLTRTILRNNLTYYSSGQGGGVYMVRGTLIVNDSIFENNSAYDGGGIYHYYYGSSFVTNTLFAGNIVSRNGGAINAYSVDLTVVDSTFVGNTAADAGGAISTNDPLIMDNSTFNRNTAHNGGAIFASDFFLANNSTFNSNVATESGGGMYLSGNDVILKHITFDEGYEITSSAIFNDAGTVDITNTLILGRCGGSLNSLGGNIEALGNTCGLTDLTDQINVSLTGVNLGPLEDNGGRTHTQLPGSNSIALETGAGAGCMFNDQRGVLRPQDFDGVNGAECDVGAVELLQCPYDSDLSLDNTTNWITPTFDACERIQAGNGFAVTDLDTVMHAGNAVVFNPNFRVLQGASLSVAVDWAFWENLP